MEDNSQPIPPPWALSVEIERDQLAKEVTKLREIIATHDLCHDLHGKVGAIEFANGCAQEQRKLFGCAPHADKVSAMLGLLGEAMDLVELQGDRCGHDDLLDERIRQWNKKLREVCI